MWHNEKWYYRGNMCDIPIITLGHDFSSNGGIKNDICHAIYPSKCKLSLVWMTGKDYSLAVNNDFSPFLFYLSN